MTEKKRILIIGIAGGLAQIFAKIILKNHPDFEVIGIDSRSTKSITALKNFKVVTMRYSRGNFENLFRENKFEYVYHLARISHSDSLNSNLAERLELGVMGTNRILDLCLRFETKKVIILSTFHVYGALSDNSIFLKEDSPLKASIKHPELRDVVEMDHMCTTWMWKYQNKIESVLLRPCNIIGSQISNTMSRYLVNKFALRPIDYNPIFQFIHEFDMAQVLYKSMEELPTGIYNVSTNEFISLKDALDVIGNKGIPFPVSALSTVNSLLKFTHLDLPEYLIDYLKFSCLIDNTLIKKHIGDDFYRFKINETLKLLKKN